MREVHDDPPAMHGRDRERAVLESLLAEASATRGAALIVRGHAGIGKTMPLTAARRTAIGTGWALPDLADAAVRSGRQDQVRDIVARAEERAARFPSPMLGHSLAYAVAVLAPEHGADAKFAEALAMDLGGWPVHRARLNLAYGAWLRRRKRILESRVPLRAARDGFDALGAAAWGRLAREELRAAGEESAGRAAPSGEQLTAQELQTAMLAAAGLSNREIGQRLFVSHRTVSSHLYRIFPKLGITGRSQLREALEALQRDPG
ncbi:LuxR C-terminal-related transcriptional regulator [Dactylosporangium sp. NPDC049140]|uniref:helix-turn-helix transcriptional regulator n=1 Tax=Dactylosporangium sp. NPDC049140 TaxID=3155647 RepID=UPI0033C193C9